jgi:hypothetical protein
MSAVASALPLAFEHSSAVVRDTDPDDLDRLAASLDHLSLYCCEPSADETDDRRPPEAVAMHNQFLVDAMPTAGEQL